MIENYSTEKEPVQKAVGIEKTDIRKLRMKQKIPESEGLIRKVKPLNKHNTYSIRTFEDILIIGALLFAFSIFLILFDLFL